MNIKYYWEHPAKLFIRIGRNNFLRLLPDRPYLQILSISNTGKIMDLNNPKTFNEKIQWLKLYNRKSEFTQLVDKYAVKEKIAEMIGADHVVPNYGVWENANEIDFNKLPNSFVLKCNHDSGGNIICRDKTKLDITQTIAFLNRCLRQNSYLLSREWPYKKIKKKILAEEYLFSEGAKQEGLIDYKFFCFSGKPEFLYVSQGLENHSTARISFFDFSGNELPFRRSDYRPLGEKLTLPTNFDEMRKLAEIIASNIDTPFCRVDLYSVNGNIYFSEITFFPCGGFLPFQPAEWDVKLGEMIDLSRVKGKNK